MALSHVFPLTPRPLVPYEWRPRFSTLIAGPANSGATVRKAQWPFPLHEADIRYGKAAWGALQPVYDFFLARQGRAQDFTFFDFNGWDWTPVGIPWAGVFAGQGSGTAATIDLPCKSATSVTVFENGAPKAGTPLSGGGTAGRDRFTPGSAIALNAVITVSFTGLRAWRACFREDVVPFSSFVAKAFSSGLGLEEVP